MAACRGGRSVRARSLQGATNPRFGSGWCSLAYLLGLLFSKVKRQPHNLIGNPRTVTEHHQMFGVSRGLLNDGRMAIPVDRLI